MSASRRTPATTPARPSPSRRRARRITLLVAAVAAVALVGVPSALGSAWLPWSPAAESSTVGEAATAPITKVPADDPARGLVHTGLKPGKKGTACVGEYQIEGTDTCSHGPDEVPTGLNVKKDVAPIAPAARAPELPPAAADTPSDSAAADAAGVDLADDGSLTLVPDAGTSSTPAATAPAADSAPAAAPAAPAPAAAPQVGPHGVVCDGDGRTGKRIQVLYAYEAGQASRFAQYHGSFRTWAAGVDTIYDASAKETGGSRHLRYVTTADCQVDVREVQLPAGGLRDFSATMAALKRLGHDRTDRKYMIFADSKVYCGIGTFTGDDSPGRNNRNNNGPSYGRTDSGCWSPSVAAHELAHNLGAVSNSAPNSTKAGHCNDDYDVMCYADGGPRGTMKISCGDRSHDARLDCNHDDYYSTNVRPGSYLATHWNMADNQFLIAGAPGGGTTPSPTPPSPTPTTPKPSPSISRPPSPSPVSPSPTSASPSPSRTSPSPTVTVTPGPTAGPGLAPLTVSDTQPNAVRLSWPAKAGATRYGVVVNGRTLGQVRGTGVRIVGLRPGTTYRLQITVRSAPYTGEVSVSTPAAAAPTAGTWFTLSNALTGTAADLYGARTADRTPVVLHEANGAANQVWRLEPAAGGVRLVSKATGKCVTPLGGRAVAGAPLAQQACSGAPAQVFTVTVGADGLKLASTAGRGLVVGLGTARYGAHPVLVLQRPTEARHQAWAALPA